MKTIKYLVAGALIFGLSAPAMAQESGFGSLLEAVSTAVKADPSNPAAGKNELKAFLKENKKNPEALVALGNMYLTQKRYDDANMYADMALKVSKNKFGDAFVLKGDIEAVKDDGGQAAMWYQQAMDIDPKNPAGYMRYANVYRKRSPEEASRALDKLRQERPDYPVDADAAHSFYTAENYEKAAEFFSKCKLETLDEYRLGEYAISQFALGRNQQSFDVAKFGAAKFPKNNQLSRLAMWNANALKDWNSVLQYANHIFSVVEDKKLANDYIYYGNALKELGKNEDAIKAYQEGLNIEPNKFELYQRMAEVYTAMGDADKALELSEKYMSKANDVKPSEIANLAQIYVKKAELQTGDQKTASLKKALEIYGTLSNKFPHLKGYALDMQAYVADMINPADAVPYYEQLIEYELAKGTLDEDAKGNLVSAYGGLGYYYAKYGNDDAKAKEYYQKVLEVDPNNANAKRALGVE